MATLVLGAAGTALGSSIGGSILQTDSIVPSATTTFAPSRTGIVTSVSAPLRSRRLARMLVTRIWPSAPGLPRAPPETATSHR